MSIRLLKKEELLGDENNPPLAAIQVFGKEVAVSDLGTLLGGVSYGAVQTPEKQFTTDYWTQSAQDEQVVYWNPIKKDCLISPMKRYPVVRPVITPSEMPFADSPETMYPLPLPNGGQIGVCEYGFYPQKYAGSYLSNRLESYFQRDAADLLETGESYTLPKQNVEDIEQAFETEKYPVYRFENKSYIRMEPHMRSTAYHSLDGAEVFLKKPYWISVEPIEWLMDDSGILIAKKGLVAGIPMLREAEQGYTGDFRKTVLSEFLRQTFVPESGVKVKMFEATRWLNEHPDPKKEDFLMIPEGENRNVVNLLTEAGVDVLRKAFPPSKWANIASKPDLHEIFSTVDITDPKNRLTLRCLNARFEAYYHKQIVLKKEMMLRNDSHRGE